MNRKNNPFVSLVALVLLAVVLVLTCAGCSAETEAAERDDRRPDVATETAGTEPASTFFYRFSIDWEPGGVFYVDGFYVITDNQTGVQYLYVKDTHGGGLTVLQPGEE